MKKMRTVTTPTMVLHNMKVESRWGVLSARTAVTVQIYMVDEYVDKDISFFNFEREASLPERFCV